MLPSWIADVPEEPLSINFFWRLSVVMIGDVAESAVRKVIKVTSVRPKLGESCSLHVAIPIRLFD